MDYQSASNKKDEEEKEKKSRKIRLQNDIAMAEGDLKKNLAIKTENDIRIRSIKRDMERLEIELNERKEALLKAEKEIAYYEAEIKAKRKEFNSIF